MSLPAGPLCVPGEPVGPSPATGRVISPKGLRLGQGGGTLIRNSYPRGRHCELVICRPPIPERVFDSSNWGAAGPVMTYQGVQGLRPWVLACGLTVTAPGSSQAWSRLQVSLNVSEGRSFTFLEKHAPGSELGSCWLVLTLI